MASNEGFCLASVLLFACVLTAVESRDHLPAGGACQTGEVIVQHSPPATITSESDSTKHSMQDSGAAQMLC
jgi:hypothetical protein